MCCLRAAVTVIYAPHFWDYALLNFFGGGSALQALVLFYLL